MEMKKSERKHGISLSIQFKRSSSISLNLYYRKWGNWVWRWGNENPNNIRQSGREAEQERRCKYSRTKWWKKTSHCAHQLVALGRSVGRPIDRNKLKAMEETNKITNFSMFLCMLYILISLTFIPKILWRWASAIQWCLEHIDTHTHSEIVWRTWIDGEFPTLSASMCALHFFPPSLSLALFLCRCSLGAYVLLLLFSFKIC